MLEIWIIQDFKGGDWPIIDRLYQVLNEEDGQEPLSLIDTDPTNQELIDHLGIISPPGLIFIVPQGSDRYVVLDRITTNASKEEVRKRYLEARDQVIEAGTPDGALDGEAVDLRGLLKGTDSNTPIGFDLLGFGSVPWWVWVAIAVVTASKASEARNTKLLWWSATGVASFNAFQKFKNK